MKRLLVVIGLVFCLMSCNQSRKENIVAIDTVVYKAEIEGWYQKRIEDLRAPNGWLNLIGLLWLEEGLNTFGSDKKNTIVFPEGKIPAQAGYFTLKQNTVT